MLISMWWFADGKQPIQLSASTQLPGTYCRNVSPHNSAGMRLALEPAVLQRFLKRHKKNLGCFFLTRPQSGHYHIHFTGKVGLTCRPVYVKCSLIPPGIWRRRSHELGLIAEIKQNPSLLWLEAVCRRMLLSCRDYIWIPKCSYVQDRNKNLDLPTIRSCIAFIISCIAL